MKRVSLVVLFVALAACGDGPLEVGKPLLLGSINGQPLPWVDPIGTTDPRPAITEGWFTLLEGGQAERHERVGRWVVIRPGDSIPLFAEWTQSGPYRRLPGKIIVTYPFWQAGQMGPITPEETLLVADRGLILRQTRFIAPLDSMVRVYCKGTVPC
ncbi:MAG TPA: hypothetical protein VGQ06_11685 [Gemmatimonadales bacterium]|jgi:hypothetical protein|nr:hypothetical protein [Gemmatimonadales bacterium]